MPIRRLRLAAIAAITAVTLGSAGSAWGQATRRASVSSGGLQANDWSGAPALSRDGRWLVFHSDATNLVPGDTNGMRDVFRKDLRNGAIVLVSVGAGGVPSNGWSYAPVVSADGRFVAFTSEASNLAPNDQNADYDVFLRDVAAGTTTRVSTALGTSRSGNAGSLFASLTPDGRHVGFYSSASDLVAVDGNSAADAFLFDRASGAIEIVSLDSSGGQGDDNSVEIATWRGPGLSDDARFVAFVSESRNLAPGVVDFWSDVYVRDRLLGTTVAASVDRDGLDGNLASHAAAISADGRWVAFMSDASNLVAGDSSASDYFVKDLRTGEVERVSVASGGGQGAGGGAHLVPVDPPAISADGRFVSFGHKYTNLVPGDTNHAFDVFRHDRWLARTERLSVDSGGVQGDDMSSSSALSADGAVAAFASLAGNLVPADSNAGWDVFAREFRVPFAAFCFGDGTPGATLCPCSNHGSYRKGCENSAQRGGAVLFAEGLASVGADTITLHAARQLPDVLVIFHQATERQAGGAGTPFGDGLQCLAGTRIRLAARRSSPAGLASFGSGIPGDPRVSVRGALPSAGGTRYYQAQYRDGASFCAPASFNTTNGISIAWRP